jgi:hypothetical protein
VTAVDSQYLIMEIVQAVVKKDHGRDSILYGADPARGTGSAGLDFAGGNRSVLQEPCCRCRAPRLKASPAFYSVSFISQPRGRYRILFSDNITDRLLGNQALCCERLCDSLWIEPGKVSEDGLVSVDNDVVYRLCAIRGRRCW